MSNNEDDSLFENDENDENGDDSIFENDQIHAKELNQTISLCPLCEKMEDNYDHNFHCPWIEKLTDLQRDRLENIMKQQDFHSITESARLIEVFKNNRRVQEVVLRSLFLTGKYPVKNTAKVGKIGRVERVDDLNFYITQQQLNNKNKTQEQNKSNYQNPKIKTTDDEESKSACKVFLKKLILKTMGILQTNPTLPDY
ncbi:hypothetical protein M0812_22853 [Anaeramoeba flamelloides]|uniref:Uncharacterized protein n=1 Tax=Anaeramoeba flamelloides TaxID=1746091 RepID=A0AAV7YK51_9EUKA|nr:hypothetical protein M0812_22853 [Anaeramoeba flamelloides]